MNKNGYLSSGDPGLAVWLNNFANKLGLYAAATGISADEVTDMLKSAAMFNYIGSILISD